MLIKMYCLDTYALWELMFDNENYIKYLSSKFLVSDWTLAEFYKTLLQRYNQKTADFWFHKIKPYVKKVAIETVLEAVRFQHSHKDKNLSLFDCVGYVFSLENSCKFLTGDSGLKGFDNVEYVK